MIHDYQEKQKGKAQETCPSAPKFMTFHIATATRSILLHPKPEKSNKIYWTAAPRNPYNDKNDQFPWLQSYHKPSLQLTPINKWHYFYYYFLEVVNIKPTNCLSFPTRWSVPVYFPNHILLDENWCACQSILQQALILNNTESWFSLFFVNILIMTVL